MYKRRTAGYSILNLLTPNSEVRIFLNHLVGTSSKEDHDSGTFTVIFARLTLDKKRVSMFSQFQGKGESLRVLLIIELVITYAKSARQYTQDCALAEAEVLIFFQGNTHYSAAVHLMTHRNKD